MISGSCAGVGAWSRGVLDLKPGLVGGFGAERLKRGVSPLGADEYSYSPLLAVGVLASLLLDHGKGNAFFGTGVDTGCGPSAGPNFRTVVRKSYTGTSFGCIPWFPVGLRVRGGGKCYSQGMQETIFAVIRI